MPTTLQSAFATANQLDRKARVQLACRLLVATALEVAWEELQDSNRDNGEADQYTKEDAKQMVADELDGDILDLKQECLAELAAL